jgi:hypothetical protein
MWKYITFFTCLCPTDIYPKDISTTNMWPTFIWINSTLYWYFLKLSSCSSHELISFSLAHTCFHLSLTFSVQIGSLSYFTSNLLITTFSILSFFVSTHTLSVSIPSVCSNSISFVCLSLFPSLFFFLPSHESLLANVTWWKGATTPNITTFSVMTLSIIQQSNNSNNIMALNTECFNAEWRLCYVKYKPFILNIVY